MIGLDQKLTQPTGMQLIGAIFQHEVVEAKILSLDRQIKNLGSRNIV